MDSDSYRLTPASGQQRTDGTDLRPSLLPFDPDQLTAVRIRPAEFARLCRVSKQTVSNWIKKGVVSLGPDGRLDPAVAARQVFERSDLAKIRARVFKTASLSLSQLRARVAELEAELNVVREQSRHMDDLARDLNALCKEIEANFADLAAARSAGTLQDTLDRLVGRIIYGVEPDNDPIPEDGAGAAPPCGEVPGGDAGPDLFNQQIAVPEE